MSEAKVINFSGSISDIAMKFTKNDEQYYQFKILEPKAKFDKLFSWFVSKDENAKQIASEMRKGDNVEGIGEENESEWQGKPVTFRNIKEMHKIGGLEQLNPKVEEVKEMPKLSVHQKIKVITGDTVEQFENNINEFMQNHFVFATQTHIESVNNRIVAVVYYKEGNIIPPTEVGGFSPQENH